jgi:hypothetical protein
VGSGVWRMAPALWPGVGCGEVVRGRGFAGAVASGPVLRVLRVACCCGPAYRVIDTGAKAKRMCVSASGSGSNSASSRCL